MKQTLIVTTFLLALSSTLADACPADELCRYCKGTTANNATTYTCEACARSFYNATTLKCEKPSTEIDNCTAYTNATTCAACDYDYYLESNKCVEITIDDCDIAFKDTAGVV